MHRSANPPASGFPLAIGAYLIWGMLPAYMILVREVPGLEFLALRILSTLPICLVLIALLRRANLVMDALRSPRMVATLLLTALLIGSNWLTFIVAVLDGQVYAASLGYYMNPLVSILIGTVFLRERLSRPQWLAVALAAAGVAVLLAGALQTLWISLILSLTFSLYGLIRKFVPVDAVSGLTVESMLLAVPSAIYVWFVQASPTGSAFGKDLELSLIIAMSGLITTAPLVMFTMAAKRMEYSTLAFIQFLSPTLIFIEGLLLYREALHPAQVASFLLIWTAIAVFSWDVWTRGKQRRAAA